MCRRRKFGTSSKSEFADVDTSSGSNSCSIDSDQFFLFCISLSYVLFSVYLLFVSRLRKVFVPNRFSIHVVSIENAL